MPAIYILFAGVFKQMFFPEISMGRQIFIGVVLTWLAVIVNVITLDVGKGASSRQVQPLTAGENPCQ